MSQITNLPFNTAQITDLTAWAATLDPTSDVLEIVDVSSNTSYKITRNQLLGISSNPLGLTDTQSPQNKTFDNTNSFTSKANNFILQDPSDTTKQGKFLLSGLTTGNTRIYTLPDYNATIATLGGVETLTSKSLTAPAISGGTIDNSTVTVDSINEHTTDNGVTIDGVNIKDGVLNTNNSIQTSNIQANAITAAKMQYGMVIYRQGGVAGDGDWNNAGTTNTDTRAKPIFIQAGTIAASSNPTSIVFPVAYNYNPLILISPTVAITSKCYPVLTSAANHTGFSFVMVKDDGSIQTTEVASWIAIGQ